MLLKKKNSSFVCNALLNNIISWIMCLQLILYLTESVVEGELGMQTRNNDFFFRIIIQ